MPCFPVSFSCLSRCFSCNTCRKLCVSFCSSKFQYQRKLILSFKYFTVRSFNTASHFRLCSIDTAEQKVHNRESVQSLSNGEIEFMIEKYEELADNDEEKKNFILMCLMEHEVLKLEGQPVPSKLSIDDMRELLMKPSRTSRRKYFSYLLQKEIYKEERRRKKELLRKEREEWFTERENLVHHHLKYGVNRNTMLIRVRRKNVIRFANQRLANAVLYGQKFVIDLDYDNIMRRQDCFNCANELIKLYVANRQSHYPFDLYVCNVHPQRSTMEALRQNMPELYAPDNFITFTNKSYLDIFPKKKLIYITSNARDVMTEFNPDAIYILGGLIEKNVHEPVVFAKAKQEEIMALRLPSNKYLWEKSSKRLPLNLTMKVLLEMKVTNDWNKAFDCVPKQKLVQDF